MTIVIYGINAKKRAKNPFVNDNPLDWGLTEFRQAAQHCIGHFAFGTLAKSMLQNEDAIAFITECLATGAHRWEKDGGRTLHCYLNQCAVWGIKDWVNMTKAAANKAGAVLSINIDSCPGSRSQLYENIADSKAIPPDRVAINREHRELANQIMTKSKLTDKQLRCFKLFYLDGNTQSETSRILKVSREAVRQCLNRTIVKIRATIQNDKKRERQIS